MTLPTQVRSYKSTDSGAPVLSGSVGALISLLDSCLVNGYGSGSVQSITRSGSTATATRPNHGLNEHDVVLHDGATEVEYNGTFKIFNVTAHTYDFEVTGTPTTPATGVITGSKPGGGFVKSFSGTNKAAYRANDAAATMLYLRVDDSTTTYATVKGYESMTDVDTGAGLFPPSSALYWLKSSTADATVRSWELVTDGFIVYLFVAHLAGSGNGHAMWVFGDIASGRQGDVYHCMIGGTTANAAGTVPGASSGIPMVSNYHSINTANSVMLARAFHQIGAAIDAGKIVVGAHGAQYIGQMTQQLGSPHTVDGAIVASPLLVSESTALIRGAMPGIYAPLQDRPGTRLSVMTNWPALPGRAIWLIPLGINNSSVGYESRILVDVTGPWR